MDQGDRVNRIRVQAPIDRDAVSPDSIGAAQTFLTRLLFERADALGVAIDWNTWRTYARKNQNGDLVVTQWARVLA